MSRAPVTLAFLLLSYPAVFLAAVSLMVLHGCSVDYARAALASVLAGPALGLSATVVAGLPGTRVVDMARRALVLASLLSSILAGLCVSMSSPACMCRAP